MNRKGLTLLEIILAIALMVLISTGIFIGINNTFRLRESLAMDGEFHNAIRIAMGVLGRDFENLFSPEGFVPKKRLTEEEKAAIREGPEGRTTDYWGQALHPTGIRSMHFNGDSTRLSFVTSYHNRFYREAPESIFEKVAYRLEDKKLIRRSSTNAFGEEDDRDPLKKQYVLLRDIESIQFRYYQRAKLTWNNRWDNESSDFKNLFPDRIEVKIVVKNETGFTFEGLYHFRNEHYANGIPKSF